MDHILEHLRGKCGYNAKGEEIPDPKPAALHIDIEAEMPLELKVMRALQSEEWKQRMEKTGRETFEEANDFDIPYEDSEFKTFHEDESGDVLAFEEGVKRGFIEEIPQERKEAANEATKKVKAHFDSVRASRYNKNGPDGLRTGKTSDDSGSSKDNGGTSK